ncbi:MAG: lactam utilization protein LamB [Flavobacteriaceae bacterium]|nr:lactam utilization protein LamB [Flavobacteriaceae bacterium]
MDSLKNHIHINLDVGEGIVDETQLFSKVSAVNIACGGHAGDDFTISLAINFALENQNEIGLHPSYQDRENFGRLSMQLSSDELIAQWYGQYELFIKNLNRENATLNHIKPHGALYNDLLHNQNLAKAFVRSLSFFSQPLIVYTMYGSALHKEAKAANFEVQFEAFLDRSYLSSLKLTPRSIKGAILEEPTEVMTQLNHLKLNKGLYNLTDTWIPIKAQTYCLHSDHSNTLAILNYLHRNFRP